MTKCLFWEFVSLLNRIYEINDVWEEQHAAISRFVSNHHNDEVTEELMDEFAAMCLGMGLILIAPIPKFSEMYDEELGD